MGVKEKKQAAKIVAAWNKRFQRVKKSQCVFLDADTKSIDARRQLEVAACGKDGRFSSQAFGYPWQAVEDNELASELELLCDDNVWLIPVTAPEYDPALAGVVFWPRKGK